MLCLTVHTIYATYVFAIPTAADDCFNICLRSLFKLRRLGLSLEEVLFRNHSTPNTPPRRHFNHPLTQTSPFHPIFSSVNLLSYCNNVSTLLSFVDPLLYPYSQFSSCSFSLFSVMFSSSSYFISMLLHPRLPSLRNELTDICTGLIEFLSV